MSDTSTTGTVVPAGNAAGELLVDFFFSTLEEPLTWLGGSAER